ncbi:YggU-like protein [Xylaria sp. CBS 124048]|nr:YggU-like protein [Xylaria sp. CBS 124048]
MSTRAAITLIQRKSSPEVLQLRCHVRPNASKVREGVVAVTDESIELCVSAPPQDGRANKAVLEVLSEALGMAKSDLQITHGLKSKDKTVIVPSAKFAGGRGNGGMNVIEVVKERLHSTVMTR